MSIPLKRVNLMLDEELYKQLKAEARDRQLSVSELERTILAKDLGIARPLDVTIERIARRRAELGSMSDSAKIVRRARDRGW